MDEVVEKVVRIIAEELAAQEPTHGGTFFLDVDDLTRAEIDGVFDLTKVARAIIEARVA